MAMGCRTRAGRFRVSVACALVAGLAGCAETGGGARSGEPMAGPTSGAGFRAPFGFQGTNIFAPLPWPSPDALRTASGAPGPAYWQQRADYEIDASLDAESRHIDARAVVTYHNNSPDRLDYLWLHLEQNVFKPDSAGALSKEPGTRFGFADPSGHFEPGCDLRALRIAGVEVPVGVYDTMARVDLPVPIDPGGSLRFEVEWGFDIPEYGIDRMGIEDFAAGPVFEIAQWFPAVAVYDDIDGWNTLGYLGQGEFHTDFGDFDVRITAPREHVVVASGELVNAASVLTPEALSRFQRARASDRTVVIRGADEVGDPASIPSGDGPLTWVFHARDARTFAWASSAAFVWDAAGVSAPGSAQAPRSRVLVQSAYSVEALPLWGDATQMARHSIEFNSRQWHPYPYPCAINVNGIVGGMEYPGIVFCGERVDRHGLYGVTDHEFGHTWFPMLVSNDERRHAWMDEGFNTFMNIYTYRDYFQQPAGDDSTRDMDALAAEMLQPQMQPIATFPDRIWQGRLGYLAYDKPAAGLWLLREEILGHERFDRAFREYIRRWAFKHPQPVDFYRTIEDVAGADLAWFWRGWFETNATLDQRVARVTREGDWVRVDLVNAGEMVMPVELLVTYDDDSTETRRLPVEVWATTNLWTAGWDAGSRRVVRVEVDPRAAFPDIDRANNTWP